MKIGLCGGTFDPFHRGHLDPVLAARPNLGWDQIIYIPAHEQPFKQDQEKTSGYHRFTMTVLATETLDDVWVSTDELDRATVSYTVETLQRLRARYPAATLDWIIGDDNLAKLPEWRQVDRLFDLGNFVVLTRLGEDSTPPALRPRVTTSDQRGAYGSIVFARNEMVPVSSTEIRRRVRAGERIDGFVHPRVSRYIQHYRLYQEGPL